VGFTAAAGLGSRLGQVRGGGRPARLPAGGAAQRVRGLARAGPWQRWAWVARCQLCSAETAPALGMVGTTAERQFWPRRSCANTGIAASAPQGGLANSGGDAAPSPPPAGPALWQSLLPACLSPPPPPGAAPQAGDEARGGLEGLSIAGGDLEISDRKPKGRRASFGSGRSSWPASPRAGAGGQPPPQQLHAGIELAHTLSAPQRGSNGSGGGDGSFSSSKMGAWQVLWRSEHQQHSLCFEATQQA
jgi:hypothetical protein